MSPIRAITATLSKAALSAVRTPGILAINVRRCRGIVTPISSPIRASEPDASRLAEAAADFISLRLDFKPALPSCTSCLNWATDIRRLIFTVPISVPTLSLLSKDELEVRRPLKRRTPAATADVQRFCSGSTLKRAIQASVHGRTFWRNRVPACQIQEEAPAKNL